MAPDRKKKLLICLLLVLTTLLTYRGLCGHDFLIIDDPAYVTDNPRVQSGLSLENIRWAFTTTRAEFWHPLTWMSYMLDTSLFGVTARGYLLVNLLFHLLNTLLVFILLQKASGAVWQSAFVAALFALHPLHVESVAWIAERKDVLSTFFGLLTLLAYIRYVRQPLLSRYLTLWCLLGLGLTAKPMLVTLPLVLLLMDYWPLGRLTPMSTGKFFRHSFFLLVVEKLPFFAMALVAAAIAFAVQYKSGALASVADFPLHARLANVLWSYLVYAVKIFWPNHLAAFYPFDADLPAWKPAAALVALVIISLAAIVRARRNPFFITGWLWYLGTLLPVIGIVKIGDFAMADRYTYIPSIGLFIIISWGIPEILSHIAYKKIIMGVGAILVIVALASVTNIQLKYWTNSERLFEHALQVTENNFFAHYGLGHVYAERGEFDRAVYHFSCAVQIRPDKATLHNDLGRALALEGRFEAAIASLAKALKIKPDKIEAHYNLGIVMAACNRPQQAVIHLSEVIRLAGSPQGSAAIRKTAMAYAETGQYAKALMIYKIDPRPEKAREAIIGGYRNWKIMDNIKP